MFLHGTYINKNAKPQNKQKMEFTIKISIPQQPQTQHQQPREEDDCVSTFLSPSVGLPLLLFLADVDFEYFRHLGTSLWQFQFGMAAARRLMDSVVCMFWYLRLGVLFLQQGLLFSY